MSRPPRLFQQVPGRDLSKDRPPEFDIAQYYFDQRGRIHEDTDVLTALMTATQAGYDLTPAQWAQWYSVALGFAPDLIVELGRSKGNSTALFTQAASRLGTTRVVSLCNSKAWVEESLPRVTAIVPPGWLDRLDARMADILDADYAQLLAGSARVLLVWDAHGFEIAETVLGRILPLLADRSHLVLMHDISDSRYVEVSRSYEGQPLWKGSSWDEGTGKSSARVNIGWMSSLQDQVVAVADFAARNDLEIGSADHEYVTFFRAHPEFEAEMRRTVGATLFSTEAHWAFLSLAGKEGPFHFPAVQRRFHHRMNVILEDVPARWFRRSGPLPRIIETTAVPWAYAAMMTYRPQGTIPTGAKPSLRVQLQVDGGPVGVGLLKADQSVFIESQRVVGKSATQTVFLAQPLTEPAGPLCVHAWDEPRPGRVRNEDVSIVW